MLLSPQTLPAPPAATAGSARASSRWLRRLAWTFGSVCLLFAALYFFRAPLLTGLAQAWVVDDPLQKADAIVVLGGSPDLRGVEAARLYHQGIAPRILYMDVKLSPSAEIGIVPSEREQTHRLLLSNNVPETALEAIGHSVSSTYDESGAAKAWLATNNATSLLIPTDLAHTRRARWIFRRELRGSGVQVRVDAIQPKTYGTRNWWRHEDGLIAFQNEWVKSLYYQWKY